MLEAVILANGNFPNSPETLETLNHASYVCCCDGAAEKLIAYGRIPNAIVGDGDSLSEEIRKEYKAIIHIIKEQEFNDLTKATRFCISQGAKKITYLGATGQREDHTLGNISLLSFYHEEFGIEVSMLTDYGVFKTGNSGFMEFRSFPGQQISIFNISCSTIISEGLRWQTYAYKQLWQGTLNEATGHSFTLKTDGNYIVYSTYKAK